MTYRSQIQHGWLGPRSLQDESSKCVPSQDNGIHARYNLEMGVSGYREARGGHRPLDQLDFNTMAPRMIGSAL